MIIIRIKNGFKGGKYKMSATQKNTDRIHESILDDIRGNTRFGRENFTDEEINNKSN